MSNVLTKDDLLKIVCAPIPPEEKKCVLLCLNAGIKSDFPIMDNSNEMMSLFVLLCKAYDVED